MNQAEKRVFLIKRLLDEDRRYRGMEVPADSYEQKRMLRSLMNVRHPKAIDAEFLTVQDEYLRQEIEDAGITRLDDLEPVCGDFYLWQGDITRLECGAIVNAANSGMTGCYVPCHACIDNCIHTFAGVQLRLDCAQLMKHQGHEEPTGQAKITKAYNLPCDYVLHTVGPIIEGRVTPEDERLLASCYRSCLELAGQNDVESIITAVIIATGLALCAAVWPQAATVEETPMPTPAPAVTAPEPPVTGVKFEAEIDPPTEKEKDETSQSESPHEPINEPKPEAVEALAAPEVQPTPEPEPAPEPTPAQTAADLQPGDMVYVEGFGWLEYQGPNHCEYGADIYENGNKIGIMG